MMQNRNSSGAHRILLLVGIVAILIVGVLYFMKRAQVNRMAITLESLQVTIRVCVGGGMGVGGDGEWVWSN